MKTTTLNSQTKTLKLVGVQEFLDAIDKSTWDKKERQTVNQVLMLGRVWLETYRSQIK